MKTKEAGQSIEVCLNCHIGQQWKLSHTSRCCSWLGGECDCLAEDIVRRAKMRSSQ